MDECIFCKIASGEIPTEFLYKDDIVVVFKDLNPQAPVHFLVVPREHVTNVLDLPAEKGDILLAIHKAIGELADKQGIASSGFRIVVNTGEDGGQTVPHLHFHVLGGRFLDWPPG
ncbi:MAG: histidine triad nucleotide-binding protein [bacterium]